MGVEIERKFLVKDEVYKKLAVDKILYRQGYLNTSTQNVVRVRVTDHKAFITIKGKTQGITRAEFEYEIPVIDANDMLQSLCEGVIVEKYRYRVPSVNGLFWEVDEFVGDNYGLVIAEIELQAENSSFDKPHWLGEEVSGDERFYNAYLSRYPYNKWVV